MKKQKKYIKCDFGPVWGILDVNNQHKSVFLTLFHVTNFNNVEPKLRPHLFEKKHSCFFAGVIELNTF
jgi:hypothetical protein